MTRTLALAAAAAVVLFASNASAQSVAFLDALADDVHPEQKNAIAQRTGEALTAAGWSVLPAAEYAARVRRARVRCSELDCADRLADALSVDWIGQLRLWAAPDGSVRQVVLTLSNVEGVTRQGAADVAGDDVLAATDRAVAATLRRVAGEEDPVACAVHGTPVGASVVIDGQPAGTLPWTGALTPGTHTVVVSRAGFVPARREFMVSSGSRITVELAPEQAASSTERRADAVGDSGDLGAADEMRDREPRQVESVGPDIGLLVTGGVLSAAGIGLVIGGAVPFAEPAACATSTCDPNAPIDARAVREPDPVALGTIIGVGGALVVTGVVLLVVGATSGGASEQTAPRSARGRNGMLSISF